MNPYRFYIIIIGMIERSFHYNLYICLTEKHKREAAIPIPSIAWYWKWVKPVGWEMHIVDTKKLKQK